ncbi:MAG: outer membrane lipoprotein-sorting protein [Candidatus Riflebacteria bacterium]|nr:outer membrane lipoprotein-sorting protein [Candidatus Riflebacteria bacterium]
MNHFYRVSITIFLLVFACSQVGAMTADEVLQGVENRYIGKTSESKMTMKLTVADGSSRNRQLIIYRRKTDNDNKDIFIHFLEPTDIKDTTYLVNEVNHEKSKYIYLSAFQNIRKIVATDYNQPFVSSDFTYEDMDDIHASDYSCSDLKEEDLDGVPVYSITTKKKDGNTSYDHSIVKVAKDSMVILKCQMFDKKDPTKQIKELLAKNLKEIQKIQTPMELSISDLVKGSSTDLIIKEVTYDSKLDDDTFSQRNMKK